MNRAARTRRYRTYRKQGVPALQAWKWANVVTLYVTHRYSMTDVAEELGMSFRTVRKILVDTKTRRRPGGSIRPGKKDIVKYDTIIAWLYSEGNSLDECAESIGMSANFCRKRLLRLGVPLRGRGTGKTRKPVTEYDQRILELHEIGFLAPQIAEMLHWSQGFIRSRLKANGIQLTKGHSVERIPHDEIVRIAFLYHNAGLDMPEIARREGKKLSWVRTRLYKTGLPLRNKSEVSKRNYEKKKQLLCA